MKKVICLIIVLSSLLLVSCAGDAPIVYSTPISTVATVGTSGTATKTPPATSTAAGTAATAGTNSTTATPAATTATSSTSGGAVPSESFKPSGYDLGASGSVETRSKVILAGNYFGVGTSYYSKADGEVYAFCFDPFCDHSLDLRVDSHCVARMTSTVNHHTMGQSMFYLNSRIYFVYWGSIYSCSEFATDVRVELELEHFDTRADYAAKLKRGGNSLIFDDLAGYGNYLFFKYIDPDGTVSWYRYDVVKRQKKRMDDDLHALEEKLGLKLVLSGIIDNYIYLYAYDDAGKFVCGYVCDYDLKNEIPTEEKSDAWQLFYTDYGIYIQDYSRYNNNGTNQTSYDLTLVKPDGTLETVVKDVYGSFKGNKSGPTYITEKYIYFINSKCTKIGYENNFHGVKECIPNTDGKLYRYDPKTGKKEVVFDGVLEDFYEIERVEYINLEERIALLYSQTRVKTDEMYEGESVYEWINMTLKCHLDENGIVDSFEVLDME